MVRFREKSYSSRDSVVRKLGRYVKKYPLLPISAASLTVAGANFIQSKKRANETASLQNEQIKATKDLTKALKETKAVLKEAKAITSKNGGNNNPLLINQRKKR
jgi:hypothetical protein